MANLSRGTGLEPKAFESEFMKQIPMRRVAEAIEMARPVCEIAPNNDPTLKSRSPLISFGNRQKWEGSSFARNVTPGQSAYFDAQSKNYSDC